MAVIIEKFDFSLICRTCLQIKTDMSIINSEIQNVFISCIGVKIEENETLPNHLCEECVDHLHKSFKFKQICLESEDILQNLLTSDSTFDHKEQVKEEVEVDLSNDEKFVNTNFDQEEMLFDSNEEIFVSELPVKIISETKLDNIKKKEDYDLYVTCKICMKKMKKFTLSDHMRSHSVPKRFNCDKCEKLFVELCELSLHRKISHGIRDSFQCTICNKVFALQMQLDRHKIRHLKDEKICNICGQSLSSNRSLERHKKIHGRVTSPFDRLTCNICGNRCENPIDLEAHLLSHTDVCAFKCDICDKLFFTLHQLGKHRQESHNIKDSFQCTICKKKFSMQEHLDRHKIHHKNKYEQSISCSLCDEQFICKKDRDLHRQSVHRASLGVLCNVCGKTMDCPASFKIHMLSHTDVSDFKCHLCDKKFKFPSGLRVHVKKHTQKYYCDFCEKNFACAESLKYHLRLHSGERPYSCKLCGKAYIKNSQLMKHMEFHESKSYG